MQTITALCFLKYLQWIDQCNYFNNVTLYQWFPHRHSWTTSANLADHKWSAEQTLGITELYRCQFHQHFTSEFFIRTSFQQLFSSYMFVKKSCQNDVCTKNSQVKCWWNWLQCSKPLSKGGMCDNSALRRKRRYFNKGDSFFFQSDMKIPLKWHDWYV